MITYFTSESVASGHPDKICDQISDAVVDSAISFDPDSRVAVETLVTANHVVMAGEVTCLTKLDYDSIARNVIKNLGYTSDLYNFSYKSPIDIFIHEQSRDIAVGVNGGGAGDQGMMFGFACNETPELMPMPIILAHRLTEKMDQARIKGDMPFLRPDGKSEIKVLYLDNMPTGIEQIILAVPHDPSVSNSELKESLIENIITPICEIYKMKIPDTENIIVNGTGKWEIGGPASDTGVTGRKIMVDTYGSYARHGGGAFSGKDCTKIDRSGAYAARYIAKNIVAAGLADKVEIRLAYVIGHRDPIDMGIELFGTEHESMETIEKYALSLLDLSVPGIIDGLGLRHPIYFKTACDGHFGRDSFPWEQIKKNG